MTDRYYPDIVDDNLEMQQAIQRVRELCSKQPNSTDCGMDTYEMGAAELAEEILKALDGEH